MKGEQKSHRNCESKKRIFLSIIKYIYTSTLLIRFTE